MVVWASAGLPSSAARRLGHGQGRLRRQRREVRHQRAMTHARRPHGRRGEDASARRRAQPSQPSRQRALARDRALDAVAAAPADRVKIIAEVKRASPSRGHSPTIPDPAAQAGPTSRRGAAPSRAHRGPPIRGSLADLEAVKAAVGLPVLRKDFIATVPGARGARVGGRPRAPHRRGARAGRSSRDLHALARELGMTPLVETHSADEVSRAADIGAGSSA